MLKCLETNKICSSSNKKCKECKLDTCKGIINMIDIQEENIRKEKIEKLNKQLPEQCRNCSFLEIIDLNRQKVKCFYLVKNKCLRGKKC